MPSSELSLTILKVLFKSKRVLQIFYRFLFLVIIHKYDL